VRLTRRLAQIGSCDAAPAGGCQCAGARRATSSRHVEQTLAQSIVATVVVAIVVVVVVVVVVSDSIVFLVCQTVYAVSGAKHRIGRGARSTTLHARNQCVFVVVAMNSIVSIQQQRLL
jgi:hypothetical protein